jgi:hypothetical protein
VARPPGRWDGLSRWLRLDPGDGRGVPLRGRDRGRVFHGQLRSLRAPGLRPRHEHRLTDTALRGIGGRRGADPDQTLRWRARLGAKKTISPSPHIKPAHAEHDPRHCCVGRKSACGGANRPGWCSDPTRTRKSGRRTSRTAMRCGRGGPSRSRRAIGQWSRSPASGSPGNSPARIRAA